MYDAGVTLLQMLNRMIAWLWYCSIECLVEVLLLATAVCLSYLHVCVCVCVCVCVYACVHLSVCSWSCCHWTMLYVRHTFTCLWRHWEDERWLSSTLLAMKRLYFYIMLHYV